jgi:hypothetical protein
MDDPNVGAVAQSGFENDGWFAGAATLKIELPASIDLDEPGEIST